ncbi:MAG: helix-turn-helix domain-containing protein [Candidatus Methanomethylicaceae archaeon]
MSIDLEILTEEEKLEILRRAAEEKAKKMALQQLELMVKEFVSKLEVEVKTGSYRVIIDRHEDGKVSYSIHESHFQPRSENNLRKNIEALLRAGLSQADVARRLGCSAGYVGNIARELRSQ